MMTTTLLTIQALVVCLVVTTALGFQPTSIGSSYSFHSPSLSISSDDDLAALLTSRLPTSVDDQVRQAVESLKRASQDGRKRHAVRLLLPVIGSTELDDWPGGARQMMVAANPLVLQILNGLGAVEINLQMLDASDGVYGVFSQAAKASDDACAVLLPSADNIEYVQSIESQVGSARNLILINAQWKRRSDFGGFFGSGGITVAYAEQYEPTFSLTNMICEGDSIRVLRNYPGPWRIFVRKEDIDTGEVDWSQIGSKDVDDKRPADWDTRAENQRDGGRLFDFGQPTYQEINDMLQSSPDFKPKSAVERAATAFNFIKDTL